MNQHAIGRAFCQRCPATPIFRTMAGCRKQCGVALDFAVKRAGYLVKAQHHAAPPQPLDNARGNIPD